MNMNKLMKKNIFSIILSLMAISLKSQTMNDFWAENFYRFNPVWIAYKISYPVNHGSMDGYYDANPFMKIPEGGKYCHLGADINGINMGNSDYGDTVYSIGRGKVIYVLEMNWSDGTQGSIIMILHKTRKGYIVSQYRHCRKALVGLGDYVEYLQPISTIGNDGGFYQAHLHFEIRTRIIKGIENGYGDPKGNVDPLKYILDFNKNI
ncbi:MAG: M23 family metallopeptidase [Bacteroidales bacterium]